MTFSANDFIEIDSGSRQVITWATNEKRSRKKMILQT